MIRTKHKSLALAALLGLTMTLASGCYYYDHDDHWHHGRYDRYDDGYYSRYDRDRDHYWDRDRYYSYSSHQSDPMRYHYND